MNQDPAQNQQQTPDPNSQPTVSPPANPQFSPQQPIQFDKPKKSRKKVWALASAMFVFTLLISAGAYGYFVYLPQTPQMVLKKAAENFVDFPSTYSISGRFDNGDGNKPDFDYVVESDGSGAWRASISSFVVAVSPGAEVIVKDGKTYIKPEGFLGYNALADKYANYSGEKTLVEYISDFAEYSNFASVNGQWIEIPRYLFENPSGGGVEGGSGSARFDLDNLTYEIGDKIEVEGKTVQEYTITLNEGNLEALIQSLSNSLIADLFNNYADDNGFPESISMTLQVDIDTKQFYSLSYDGRPFDDATFGLTARQQAVNISAPDGAVPLVDVLDYGIAWTELIRSDTQSGSSEKDKERIADLKGMKLAFEIYKSKNGVYPDRYSIAVTQEGFLNQNMPHVDHQLFIDPNGRRVGSHGSQYAYVPQRAEGDDLCGEFNYGPCETFFLVTTLDDGTEYQLNSGF